MGTTYSLKYNLKTWFGGISSHESKPERSDLIREYARIDRRLTTSRLGV